MYLPSSTARVLEVDLIEQGDIIRSVLLKQGTHFPIPKRTLRQGNKLLLDNGCGGGAGCWIRSYCGGKRDMLDLRGEIVAAF